MSKISEIVEGWANLVKDSFNLLDEETKSLARVRMLKCDVCPLRIHNTCSTSREGVNIKTGEKVSGCGCQLSAKTMSPQSKCPLGKW